MEILTLALANRYADLYSVFHRLATLKKHQLLLVSL
jgi:hypothetical protein